MILRTIFYPLMFLVEAFDAIFAIFNRLNSVRERAGRRDCFVRVSEGKDAGKEVFY
jgi:hypothetical protein